MNAPLQARAKTKGAAPVQANATFATDSTDSSADRAAEKAFCTLQGRYAVAGHTLYRTVNADGTMLYLAGKRGYVRELKNLETVAAFLALIGGAA